MLVGLLTESEKNLLFEEQFTTDSYFNPVQDNNGNWIISQEEMSGCQNSEFIWVKSLPLIEFVPKEIDFPTNFL
jgi:hypothetical protein